MQLVRFFDNDMSCSPENQLFLRSHLRRLFLDPSASGTDQLVWLDYICKEESIIGLAKLILLLYSPIVTLNSQGIPKSYMTRNTNQNSY